MAVSAAASGPPGEPRERYTLSGNHAAIYNLAGELKIERGTGREVVVEVARGGRDAGSLRVETGPKEDRVTLRVVYPSRRVIYPPLGRGSKCSAEVADDGTFDEHGFGFLSGKRTVTVSGSGSGTEAHADLRVLVPSGQRLTVRLVAGKTQITGVDAKLSVSQGAGPIESRGTRGTLSIDTGSGTVRVTEAQGDVDLDTGSGSVTVSGVRGARLSMDTGSGDVRLSDAEVDILLARTGSGSVDLDAVRADEIRLDTGSGAIRLDLQSDVSLLDADTGSGGVTVTVPAKLGAEFDVETGSGGIEMDVVHEVFEVSSSHVRGRIGDGRGRIRIETGSGGVRMQRRTTTGARSHLGVGTLLAPAVE
jgi:DUF4097 and DUF4098 domain-containing protein YvlB